MNEPNNHAILGDLAAIVEQHGGSWRIEREPYRKMAKEPMTAPTLWRVTWVAPLRDGMEPRVSCVRSTIEDAAAHVLRCIESFTSPDGGLDL